MSQPLTTDEIRKRIVKVVPMRLGDILPNPRNPKSHPKQQREALRGSVRELGFGTIPIAYTSQRLGGKLAFGDGHMRGDEFADFVTDVAITDYTDEEIDKFLLYADPIAAMAEYESQQLDGLLRDISTNDEALQAMVAELGKGITTPTAGDWAGGLGGLPNSDRAPFQQMTFTLHDEQAEQVKRALAAAGKIGDFADSPNQNSNGNALAFICEMFVTEHEC